MITQRSTSALTDSASSVDSSACSIGTKKGVFMITLATHHTDMCSVTQHWPCVSGTLPSFGKSWQSCLKSQIRHPGALDRDRLCKQTGPPATVSTGHPLSFPNDPKVRLLSGGENDSKLSTAIPSYTCCFPGVGTEPRASRKPGKDPITERHPRPTYSSQNHRFPGTPETSKVLTALLHKMQNQGFC